MKCSPLLAVAAVFSLAAPVACAQSEERPMLPEVQALWTPYQAALKAVEADRDQKLKNLDSLYMLNLDKQLKERAAVGDLDGALEVKAEMDRLGARRETTAEQIKAMNPALQKLRVARDAALKNYHAEAARSSAALLQKLLADLEEVQRRITTTGDLDRALRVMAEKERIAAEPAQPRPAPAAPEVKVGSVPGTEPPKVQTDTSSRAAAGGNSQIAQATRERPFENGLGMKFVPVPITGGPTGGQRVLFSIWETRVRDHRAFLVARGKKRGKAMFPETQPHPVVNINWAESQVFCEWLTEHERRGGRLGTAECYRLPTDHEWSCAVGIGEREDPAKTPAEKDAKIPDVFPWGNVWPPPKTAGNYGGTEDGFNATAPVGSFAANGFGIFDLGGNVWEWCEDSFSPNQKERHTLRGGAFDRLVRHDELSSCRYGFPAKSGSPTQGFRVVIAPVAPAR